MIDIIFPFSKPRCPSAELVDRSAIKEETPGDDYLPMEKIPSVNGAFSPSFY